MSGDGSFSQYLADFNTAVKYDIKIIHILLNNDQLGKISKEQRTGEWDVWQTSLHNPDFSKYTEICGGFGVWVTQKEALDRAIAEALTFDGPAIVEFMADPELI